MKHTVPLALAVIVLLPACGAELETLVADEDQPLVASLDQAHTVDVASWNIEWFGDDARGPSDEPQQHTNATDVLARMGVDMIGLVEVVSEDAFASLVASLPGYRGLLVTEAVVEGGREAYGPDDQKVALLVRDRFEVTRARVILTEESWAFAGRPPLEVSLAFQEDGRDRTLDVVVAHFKAMANRDGWRRRARAADALHAWLAAEHAQDWALVVGDFNDDIDASTYGGRSSPFAQLAEDPALRFTTDALTAAGMATTVSYDATIDHHLATARLARRFVESSAFVVPADSWVDDYDGTTSDHYPVLTRYDLR